MNEASVDFQPIALFFLRLEDQMDPLVRDA